MNIYVSNLSFQAMDLDVRTLFSAFGEVKSARVVMDNFTRRSRGCAFVEMAEPAAALRAIERLNNSSFMQKTISVREAMSDKK